MSTTPLYYFENITNPMEFEIGTIYDYNDTVFYIRNRTKKGWTIDFILNTSGQTITSGNTFYYWGIKDEYLPANFVDNNLSFDFTVDNRIRWRRSVYADCCDGDLIVIEESDKTPVLCTGGTSADFNVTITFERNFDYIDCYIPNAGGVNDLFTGWTLTNPLDVMTGATPVETTIWTLTNKWYEEKYKRLGTLKIYLNGRVIYKNKSWEEVIPTTRQSLNNIIQVLGGGTLGSGGIHQGVSPYIIKKVTYYETPLSQIEIRDNYLDYKEIYDINECTSGCNEMPIS